MAAVVVPILTIVAGVITIGVVIAAETVGTSNVLAPFEGVDVLKPVMHSDAQGQGPAQGPAQNPAPGQGQGQAQGQGTSEGVGSKETSILFHIGKSNYHQVMFGKKKVLKIQPEKTASGLEASAQKGYIKGTPTGAVGTKEEFTIIKEDGTFKVNITLTDLPVFVDHIHSGKKGVEYRGYTFVVGSESQPVVIGKLPSGLKVSESAPYKLVGTPDTLQTKNIKPVQFKVKGTGDREVTSPEYHIRVN